MKRALAEGYHLVAARFLRKQLRQFSAQLEGVCTGTDPEYVHRARVASRRLRTGLDMFRDVLGKRRVRRWRKAIRRLSRALGTARDLDVQIHFTTDLLVRLDDAALVPGIARLLVHLEQQRDQLQPGLVEAVRRLKASGVLGQLAGELKRIVPELEARGVTEQTPIVFRRAEQEVQRRFDELLAYRDALARPDDQRRHHALRIAAKHLRYTMEMCAPCYGSALDGFIALAKEVQTLLGEIHDCDVWVSVLEAFLAQQATLGGRTAASERLLGRWRCGLEWLCGERRRHRAALFARLVERWHQAEREGMWAGLLESMRAHAAAVAKQRGARSRGRASAAFPASEEAALSLAGPLPDNGHGRRPK